MFDSVDALIAEHAELQVKLGDPLFTLTQDYPRNLIGASPSSLKSSLPITEWLR